MINYGWGPAKCFVGGCGGRLLIGLWGLGKATEFLRLPMGLVVQLSGWFGAPWVGTKNTRDEGVKIMNVEAWLQRNFRDSMEAEIRYTRQVEQDAKSLNGYHGVQETFPGGFNSIFSGNNPTRSS